MVEGFPRSWSLEPKASPLLHFPRAHVDARFHSWVPVTGPEVLERAHAHLARHARLVIVVLLAYIAVAGLVQAANRAFWFDEIFTVAIARLGSMTDVWRALAGAADTSPPGFYVIERSLSGLIPNELIGFRLASIVAVPLTCLCLFVFLAARYRPGGGRDRRRPAAADGALQYVLGRSATLCADGECAGVRGGRLAEGIGAALVVRAGADARRVGLIDYYAVFALLPFAAAELTWSVVQKGYRPRVWLALTAGGLSFVAYWPLLRGLRDTYGQHYWAKASIFRAIASYDENPSLLTVGAMLGLVAVLSGALVVYLARTVVPRADDPIPPDVPPAHCVLALGLLWLPWVALLAAKVGGGGVAARYTIGATLGLALSAGYVAYWLGRRASAVILMCLLLAFASKEVVFWGAEDDGRNVRRVDIDGFERLLSQGEASLPVVVTNGREFVPLAYYAPRHITGRLVALVDPQAAREHTGTDSIELDIEVLQRYLPIVVQATRSSKPRTTGSFSMPRLATASGGSRACCGTASRCERSRPMAAGVKNEVSRRPEARACVGSSKSGLLQ